MTMSELDRLRMQDMRDLLAVEEAAKLAYNGEPLTDAEKRAVLRHSLSYRETASGRGGAGFADGGNPQYYYTKIQERQTAQISQVEIPAQRSGLPSLVGILRRRGM